MTVLTQWVAQYWIQVIFGVIVSALGLSYRVMTKKLKDNRAEQMALKQGMQALLHDRLIQAHNFFVDRGTCPIYVKESLQDMFQAYTGLEGNGTVPRLVETIMKLPSPPNEQGA